MLWDTRDVGIDSGPKGGEIRRVEDGPYFGRVPILVLVVSTDGEDTTEAAGCQEDDEDDEEEEEERCYHVVQLHVTNMSKGYTVHHNNSISVSVQYARGWYMFFNQVHWYTRFGQIQ